VIVITHRAEVTVAAPVVTRKVAGLGVFSAKPPRFEDNSNVVLVTPP